MCTEYCMAELAFVHILQNSLDSQNLAQYAFVTMIFARRASSNNPGNNRQLPQNLWDVFDRSGMSAMR